MNKLSGALWGAVLILISLQAIADTIQGSIVPPEAQPYLEKMVGSFTVSANSLLSSPQGTLTIVMNPNGELQAQANFPLLDNACGAQLQELAQIQYEPKVSGSVDAWFRVFTGRCSVASPFLKVSFNRTLFGADNFTASILINKGFRTNRGGIGGRVEQQWILRKQPSQ